LMLARRNCVAPDPATHDPPRRHAVAGFWWLRSAW
jgi:hypothetical protein